MRSYFEGGERSLITWDKTSAGCGILGNCNCKVDADFVAGAQVKFTRMTASMSFKRVMEGQKMSMCQNFNWRQDLMTLIMAKHIDLYIYRENRSSPPLIQH